MISKKQKSFKLTDVEKNRVLRMINSRCHPEDNQPEEVITKEYGGDTDAYIIDMLHFEGFLEEQFWIWIHLKDGLIYFGD